MPFSLKFWQVQGKDLREVRCEALSDEQRLQDWLAREASHAGDVAWVVDNPKAVLPPQGKSNSQQKSPSPSNAPAFQETKARAENGDAAAQAALGFRYEMGIDVPAGSAEAVKWYRMAAEQGNFRAQCNLNQMAAHGLIYGPGTPVPKDSAEAAKWCLTAAEKGNVRAQFNLGQMYEWGDGVPKDAAKAAKWYREAAEQGQSAAQYKVGLCYCNGQGFPQNTSEAVKWWRHAAEQGEAAAQYMLGLCYCNAQGVPQDYAEAAEWYHKAAEQGDAHAQSKLGDAYYIGVGVTADHFEAAKWYTEAAEQGVASAQRHLGIMYGLGQGVPRDYTEAYKWYTLAADQHDNNAVHNRDSISGSMTSSEIADGQRLSREFLARRQRGDLKRDNGQAAMAPALPDRAQKVKPSQPGKSIGGKNVLGIDLLVLGSRVPTTAHQCIDLLAMDGQANLVVLELKRDGAPHEIVAQALDHASWARNLTYEQIDAMADGFIGKPLSEAFKEHFGNPIPEKVNASLSMMILTPELDASSERILRYLAKKHGVPIHVHFMAIFKTAVGEFLASASG
jgi:TPR repeat protein